MEITLNLAWALCSLGLVWYWMRSSASNPIPRRTQMLALAMVVLLLLPVISLSDDLVAWQSPAETDMCLRRASDKDGIHPSIAPVVLALPVAMFSGPALVLLAQDLPPSAGIVVPPSLSAPSHFSRPPPQV